MNRRNFLLASTLFALAPVALAMNSRQRLSSDFGERSQNPLADLPSQSGRGTDIPATTAKPLQPSSKVITQLAAGQNLLLSGRKFESIHDDYVVHIYGSSGSNQTVTIEDCLFRDNKLCVRIENVDNVIITGTRFEKVGYCCRVDNCKSIDFTFNQAKDHGILHSGDIDSGIWSNNFIQVTHSPAITHLRIEDNICDASGDSRENVKGNTFREDRIAIYRSQYIGAGKGSIARNQLRGSESHCESTSAGGIVFDQQCRNFVVKDNIVVNTGQYCFGNANSDGIVFERNQGFISYQHDFNIRQHVSKSDSHFAGPGVIAGVIVSRYGQGEIGTTEFHANQVVAQRSNNNGTGVATHFNWATVGDNIYDGNSFRSDSPDGGELPHPDASILPVDMFSGLTNQRFLSVKRPLEVS